MFDVSFAKIIHCTKESNIIESSKYKITSIGLSMWEDHCVECSVPYCYHTCKMYSKRYDGWCVRMENGLVRNYNYRGLYDYGIECQFKKWAKLETYFYQAAFSLEEYTRFTKWNNKIIDCLGAIYKALPKNKFLTKAIFRPYQFWIRNKWLESRHTIGWNPDYFLCDCYLVNKAHVQIFIQIDNGTSVVYSRTFKLEMGFNHILIPANEINHARLTNDMRIFITPLGEDSVTEIVFTYLNFVQMEEEKPSIPSQPAKKVKVVAWDLDNTLWNGILVEDGLEKLTLNENAVSLIKELDHRGILNTICSKNSHEDAMAALKYFGIDEYFLNPAINWGQKSVNLLSIAESLNLGIDSFAFVDDNVREREEVALAIPCIRIYSEQEIDTLLSKSEFDVPITEESRVRRLSYINEQKRIELKAAYTENYDDYLKGLGMQLDVFPINESNHDRSLELLERTNQLNLRTVRYTVEQFDELISNKDYECFAFSCHDKFGDYGQVGFMSVQIKNATAIIKDFVISCRVAKKKVEEAMVFAVVSALSIYEIKTLSAELVRTKRNKPLVDVFENLPFVLKKQEGDSMYFEIENIALLKNTGIIKIESYTNPEK